MALVPISGDSFPYTIYPVSGVKQGHLEETLPDVLRIIFGFLGVMEFSSLLRVDKFLRNFVLSQDCLKIAQARRQFQQANVNVLPIEEQQLNYFAGTKECILFWAHDGLVAFNKTSFTSTRVPLSQYTHIGSDGDYNFFTNDSNLTVLCNGELTTFDTHDPVESFANQNNLEGLKKLLNQPLKAFSLGADRIICFTQSCIYTIWDLKNKQCVGTHLLEGLTSFRDAVRARQFLVISGVGLRKLDTDFVVNLKNLPTSKKIYPILPITEYSCAQGNTVVSISSKDHDDKWINVTSVKNEDDVDHRALKLESLSVYVGQTNGLVVFKNYIRSDKLQFTLVDIVRKRLLPRSILKTLVGSSSEYFYAVVGNIFVVCNHTELTLSTFWIPSFKPFNKIDLKTALKTDKNILILGLKNDNGDLLVFYKKNKGQTMVTTALIIPVEQHVTPEVTDAKTQPAPKGLVSKALSIFESIFPKSL